MFINLLTQLFYTTQCFFDVDPLSEFHPYMKSQICILTFSYNELIYTLIIIMLSGLIIHMIFFDKSICTRCQDNHKQIVELRRKLEIKQKFKLKEMLNSIDYPIKGIIDINKSSEPSIPEIFNTYKYLIPSESNV